MENSVGRIRLLTNVIDVSTQTEDQTSIPREDSPTPRGRWAPRIEGKPWSASTTTLATAVVALLTVSVVVQFLLGLNALRASLAAASVDRDAYLSASSLDPVLTVSRNVTMLVTAATFLVWFYRVWTSNRSEAYQYGRSASFAVIGWFIPVAHLVFGPEALRDLWWGTRDAKHRDAGLGPVPDEGQTPRLLRVWWWTWVGMTLIGVIGAWQQRRIGSADDLALAALLVALEAAVIIAAGLLMISIVRRIMGFCAR